MSKKNFSDLDERIPYDGWIPALEKWTYATADSPTYTFTTPGDKTTKYSVGMRLKYTQTTVQYAIVTVVAYATGTTTMTIYCGTDYSLANAVIQLPYYSSAKAPFGFPLSTSKWSVLTSDTASRSQVNPTANTWYNLGSVTISIPIGVWRVRYETAMENSGNVPSLYTTLSTANNSESDKALSTLTYTIGSTVIATVGREKLLTLASKTSYYLNTMQDTATNTTIYNRGDLATTVIEAVCVYL